MKKKIKVFTAGHCIPCNKITELIEKGLVESDIDDVEIDLVDIETEEGFEEIEKNNLTSIPTATYEDRACKLNIDREVAVITCKPTSEPEVEAFS